MEVNDLKWLIWYLVALIFISAVSFGLGYRQCDIDVRTYVAEREAGLRKDMAERERTAAAQIKKLEDECSANRACWVALTKTVTGVSK